MTNSNLIDMMVNAHHDNHGLYARFLVDGEHKEELLTFRELLSKSQALAARMQRHYSPGTRVILLFPSGLEFIISFWACVLGGFIAVPVNFQMDSLSIQRLLALINDASPEILLTTKLFVFPPILNNLFNASGIIFVDHSENNTDYDFIRPNLEPSHPVFLQYTSGSTGAQKGVIVNHQNIIQNVKMIRHMEEHNRIDNENLVSWLPHYHDMGLIGCIIVPALCHFTLTFMSPLRFLQKPIRWLRAISKYRASFSVAPNFGYSLCTKKIKEEEMIGIDLQCWSIALNGAEPVRASTLDQFYQKFSSLGFRKESFFPTYGLAEATLFVSGGVKGIESKRLCINSQILHKENKVVISTADANASMYVSCGKPGLGLKIKIVDPVTTESLSEDKIGEICIQGNNVTAGYWQDHDKNASLFIPINGEQFLRTGDLGFIHEDELYVTGRLKDLIIIRGRNLYAHDLEQSIEACHAAIKEGTVVSFYIDELEAEQVVILVEVSKIATLSEREEIKRVILERLVINYGIDATIKFVAKGSLFKTSSGKLQRSKCKDSYLTGTMTLVES